METNDMTYPGTFASARVPSSWQN